MRILVLSHYFPEHRSGIPIIAEELARRQAARGLQVEWMASLVGPGEGPDGVQRVPVRAWNVTERRFGFPYPLWGPVSLARLGQAVARADVIHLHDCLYMGNVAAYLWARLLGKPVVVTQHIGAIPYTSRLLRGLMGLANRTLGRLVLGGCDHVIYYSPKVRDYFAELFRLRRPPAFLENGVTAEIFHPVSEERRRQLRAELGWSVDRPVLLFVGRFVEKKGLKLLQRLAREVTNADWAFVGWGPEDPAHWGLPHVHCLGALPQPAIARCYQAADLLVLPSVGEGFPLVVQEGMACGLPAMISTETAGGAPEASRLLYCLDLRAETWREALGALVAAPEHIREQRAAVAAYVREHWDWNACTDGYCRLFASLSRTRITERSRDPQEAVRTVAS